MRSPWKFVLLVLGMWLVVLVYMFGSLYPPHTETDEKTLHRLTRALAQLELLKSQNGELRKLIDEVKDSGASKEFRSSMKNHSKLQQRQIDSNLENAVIAKPQLSNEMVNQACEPSKEEEMTRMRIENGVDEFWFYLRSELKQLSEKSSSPDAIAHILEDGAHQQRSIMTDLHLLAEKNQEWREKEHEDLSDLVQRRMYYLQNPEDCEKARKLVCNLNKGCGYGCQVHHVIYCFLTAYGTQRTLILESSGWRYSKSGWESVFLPLSQTCTSTYGARREPWGSASAHADSALVVELPIVDNVRPRPPYLPLSIPRDLADRLQRLHSAPAVWWVSQFVKYLLRYQPKLANEINAIRDNIGFMSPIVGVHVRRTDKVGTEAAFHTIEEYMYHVDDYYEKLERYQTVKQRRIYLATDEPPLIEETRKKYPHYQVIADVSRANSGAFQRYTDAGLHGIVMDIHFLGHTDFLVCTFSSQVSRLAYEIMNSLHVDAGSRFRSLDDIYYFGGQKAHNQKVLYEHKPSRHSEIALRPGDIVGVAGNHWDGYSKGINRRTGKIGLYPSYKVEDQPDIVDFPNYPQL